MSNNELDASVRKGGGFESTTPIQNVTTAVSWNVVLNFLTIIFQMASSIIIVRMLGKDSYGVYSLLTNIIRYSSMLCILGLDVAIYRYVTELKLKNNLKGIHTVIGSIIVFQVVVWFLLLLFFFLFSEPIGKMYQQDLTILLLVGTTTILFPSVISTLNGLFTCFYNLKVQAYANLAANVVYLSLLWLLLATTTLQIIGIFVAQIAMSVILLTLYAIFVPRVVKGAANAADSEPVRIWRIAKFYLPYVVTGIMGSIFLRQSETLVLGYFRPASEVGIYNLAYSFAQRFLDFFPAIMFGVGNVVVTSSFMHGREHLSHTVRRYYKVLFLILAPVSIGGFVTAQSLVTLIYGGAMAEAGWISSILFLTLSTIVLVNPFNFVIRAEEKTWLNLYVTIPAGIISLTYDLLLIPKYGLPGATAASSLSFVSVTLFEYLVFRKAFPYIQIPWRFILKCYLTALPFVLILPFKNYLTSFLGIGCVICVFVVLWLYLVKKTSLLGEEEMRLIDHTPLPFKKPILAWLVRS